MIYAGCYTPFQERASKIEKRGIEVLEWDSQNMLHRRTVIESSNPSWLIRSSRNEIVYAANEEGLGGVTGFFRAGKGELSLQDSIRFPGRSSCHLCLSPDEKYLFVSDYSSGDLTVLKCKDGKLSVAQRIEYSGRGSHPVRQEAPHIHSSWILPDWSSYAREIWKQENSETFTSGELIVADLGTDRLYRYLIGTDAPLMPHPIQPWIQLPAGSGPRHMAFHWKERIAYVTAELSNHIILLRFDEKNAGHVEKAWQLTERNEGNLTSHLALWPEKRMLYAAVRGTDELIWFEVENTGELLFRGRCPSGGKVPRHFLVDRSRSRLLAANQGSGNLSVFEINDKGDILPEPLQQIKLPDVACVLEI